MARMTSVIDFQRMMADITRLDRADWLDFVSEAASAFRQAGLFEADGR